LRLVGQRIPDADDAAQLSLVLGRQIRVSKWMILHQKLSDHAHETLIAQQSSLNVRGYFEDPIAF
jgi:hypothetical protein